MPGAQLRLEPLGQTLSVPPGTALPDVLFPLGVEFPCGGRGRCKGCRIRVLEGEMPATADDRALLSEGELAQGWRLACRTTVTAAVTIELAQWEPEILSDYSSFSFEPRDGFGIALDVGTTTLVAQLLDGRSGNVAAVRTALNPQAQLGADIMSRIEFAVGGGQGVLEELIRTECGRLVRGLMEDAGIGPAALNEVIVVGNTVMHHLFCGISVEPLAHVPFVPKDDGQQQFLGHDLRWDLPVKVTFLPCLGGFVGSDILAGILATGLDTTQALTALVDLGTNGEIVVGNGERMLCASTAAGPAFEGARISAGMRAATGAIAEVWRQDGHIACRVLGQGPPRGICGSGLVDAVAVGLDLKSIQASGRLDSGRSFALTPDIALTQQDIRELQLAKGAIAAGLRILLQQWGAAVSDLTRVYLAGAFGNYIRLSSAQRIGLLQVPLEKVEPSGNTALRGAKMALFRAAQPDLSFAALRRRVQHVSLHEDEQFQEVFVSEMPFPV
ncbi:MAG: ASKHA domain-containing protein [Verrucomicrobiota bacterium]